jgi:hypothetical protein
VRMKATDIGQEDAALIMGALQRGAEPTKRIKQAVGRLYGHFMDPWERHEGESIEAWCERFELTDALNDLREILRRDIPMLDHLEYRLESNWDTGEAELWVEAYTRCHDVEKIVEQSDIIDDAWVRRGDYQQICDRLHYTYKFID